MKAERIKGFTLVELLTALAIVAILIGLLMPAIGQIRKYAGNVKQKAQINGIEIGLSCYKNDFGQYPPSHGYDAATSDPNHADYMYSGVQTLAEAMFGMDLLGVHPSTAYRADGYDVSGSAKGLLYPVSSAAEPNSTNLGKRKGPYLDRTNIGVFKPDDVYTSTELTSTIKIVGRMICDTFATQSKKIGSKYYKIGTPILYFRANPSALNTQLAPSLSYGHPKNIYDYYDNYDLLLAANNHNDKNRKFVAPSDGSKFYSFITDSMILNSIPPLKRPVKPDSYLLISAGPDGIYGTKDDVCNFDPNSIQ
jgi:prepilin-type N-terminal cleavage/methylation domain-containing protein